MFLKALKFSLSLMILTLCAPGTAFLQADDGSSMPTPMAKKGMTQDLSQLHGKEFEIRFLKEMIMHHQSAIDMAELVPKNTKRAELNEMASNIISAQNAEISRMKTWLSDWYQETPSMETSGGMADMKTGGSGKMGSAMNKLEKSRDRAFDLLFLRDMIKHHQDAVDMSRLVSESAEHSELKELARNIIKDQTGEIQQMKKWQKAW